MFALCAFHRSLVQVLNEITPHRPITGQCRARLNSSTNHEEQENLSSIAMSLKETNQLLTKMSQRIDKVDNKMKEFEAKFHQQSPGLTPSRTRKKVVPAEVRVSNNVGSHTYLEKVFPDRVFIISIDT